MLRFGRVAVVALSAWIGQAGAGFAQDGRFLTSVGAAASPVGFAQACADYAWLCDRLGRAPQLAEAQFRDVAERVNAQVNHSVAPRYTSSLKWTLPSGQAGDCVGYAMLKLQMLLQSGVPASHVFLATVLTGNGENHAGAQDTPGGVAAAPPAPSAMPTGRRPQRASGRLAAVNSGSSPRASAFA